METRDRFRLRTGAQTRLHLMTRADRLFNLPPVSCSVLFIRVRPCTHQPPFRRLMSSHVVDSALTMDVKNSTNVFFNLLR